MNGLLKNINTNGSIKVNVLSALKRLPYFKTLNNSELRELAGIIYVRRFKKDEIIFNEHEPGIGMYIVYHGSVTTIRHSTYSSHEIISTYTKDDFFGEHSLFSEIRTTSMAIALEDCCLLGIFRPEMNRLIERKPKIGSKILLQINNLICNRLQAKEDELFDIKSKLSNINYIK